MRTVLIAFLASAFLNGCRNVGTTSVTPLPGRSPAPPDVLRLADLESQVRDDIRDDFITFFFRGFTSPNATMGGGCGEAAPRGFLAGQEYRRANPTRIKETMEGFGYTATEADGIWTVSFEHSGFRPKSHPAQTWWLSHFGDTQSDVPTGTKTPDKGIHVRVTGYLSPSGHFGHVGRYDHEFFATTISKQ